MPRQTGYRGRRAIAEFLNPTPAIDRLIFDARRPRRDRARRGRAGMRPMFDAGLDAALAGDTTIEEVVRSIRAEA